MVERLFFFHNPKAGGTSVVDTLSRLFPSQRRCPRIENDAAEHATRAGQYQVFRGYDFYAGHYGLDIYEAMGERLPAATNFRWPVDRIVSVYRYFRHMVDLTDAQVHDPRFAAVQLAKSLSLDDFVTCDAPAVMLHTCDHHFRQLTGSGWSPILEQDLCTVKALIDRMVWFYVCEHPYESLVWADAAFGGKVSSVQHLNVTRAERAAATLSPQAYRRLISRNQGDIAIYQYALDRLLAETAPVSARLIA